MPAATPRVYLPIIDVHNAMTNSNRGAQAFLKWSGFDQKGQFCRYPKMCSLYRVFTTAKMSLSFLQKLGVHSRNTFFVL